MREEKPVPVYLLKRQWRLLLKRCQVTMRDIEPDDLEIIEAIKEVLGE